jgi:hypothetical protein
MICEYCNNEHDGTYGSGRFCRSSCAKGFASRDKRLEINLKISAKLTKLPTTKVCRYCNKEFSTKRKSKVYCNITCSINDRLQSRVWKDEDYMFNFGFIPKTKLYDILSSGYHLRNYKCVYVINHPLNTNTVLFHRSVMEMYIGRLLTKDEIVHHIDNNPENNVIMNLQILSSSLHSKLHYEKRTQTPGCFGK